MKWLPAPIRLKQAKRGVPILQDGVPHTLELRRLSADDNSLHAVEQSVCCDCGLQHIFDHEVRRDGKRWILSIRAYRVE